jgi:hypothetical protein
VSRHEHRDANVRTVVVFGVGLSALLVVVLFVMGWLFSFLARREQPVAPSPMATTRELPPAPRLQSNPPTDLEHMRAAEDAILSSYAWVDRQAGIVRIPIDQAMDLLAQRGLPARSSTAGNEQKK